MTALWQETQLVLPLKSSLLEFDGTTVNNVALFRHVRLSRDASYQPSSDATRMDSIKDRLLALSSKYVYDISRLNKYPGTIRLG